MKFERIFTPALLSLIVNAAYCIYNATVGILLPSWWFLTLSAYYVVLSVMRLAVLKIRAKARTDKNLAFFARRFCGFMFLALSVVLAGTAYLSVSENRGIKHGEILMIAKMNKEALKKTIETGKAHYWSTSRNKQWLKGESSGHTQEVEKILVDCDMDAIVLKIKQNGAACHEGYYSCFFRDLDFKNSPDIDDLKDNDLKINQKRVFNPDDVY